VDIQSLLSDLKAERDRIHQAISAIEGLFSPSAARRGRPPKAKLAAAAPGNKPRGMSPAARKRISEAMKKRWAASKVTAAPKRKPMSPTARKRLSEMMKKRWAEQKRTAKTA
jgi:hypothetical protein